MNVNDAKILCLMPSAYDWSGGKAIGSSNVPRGKGSGGLWWRDDWPLFIYCPKQGLMRGASETLRAMLGA